MKTKTKYQIRVDNAQRDYELDSTFLEFMKAYLQLFRDTGNQEYLEIARWVKEKKKEIIGTHSVLIED